MQGLQVLDDGHSALSSCGGDTGSSPTETPNRTLSSTRLLPSSHVYPATSPSLNEDRHRDTWNHETPLKSSMYPEGQMIQKIRREQRRLRQARELQKHNIGLWLVLVYSALTTFSWIVTCVLCYRPLNIPTYYDPNSDYTRAQYDSNDRWRRGTKVMSSFVGSVTIPVTSAICAKATVVYCQKTSNAQNQTLTMRQMLALADKGWSDIRILFDMMRPSTSRRTRCTLLINSALLCGLGIAIPSLQEAFVQTVHLQVSTSDSIDNTDLGVQSKLKSLSSMRASMGNYSKIVRAVTENTVSATIPNSTYFTRLPGRSNNTTANSESSTASWDSTGASFLETPLFTSSSPVRTDTGQYRVYTLRLNSSLLCDSIEPSEFPAPCEGSMAFETSYSNVNSSGSSLNSYPCSLFTFRDVTEEFFLDFQYSKAKDLGTAEDDIHYPYMSSDPLANFTRRCRSSTTLGYFSLPNNLNNHSAGLTYEECSNSTLSCPELGASNDKDSFTSSPSPLNISVAAIFGDGTFFNNLRIAKDPSGNYQELCLQLREPVSGLTSASDNGGVWGSNRTLGGCESPSYSGKLASILYEWLTNFRDLDSITTALSYTISLSNKAIINQDLTEFIGNDIYEPLGYGIMKPSMSTAAMILLSILILIQLLGLCFLALYAHSRPTWTDSLNSFALMRIGAAMADDLPLISAVEAEELTMLDEICGWVGDSGGLEESRTLTVGGPEQPKGEEKYRMISAGSKLQVRAWDYNGFRRKAVYDEIGG